MKFKAKISISTLLVLLVTSQYTSAQEKEVLYNFYGKAPKGSKMRPVEAKSPIPFNKKYKQLTERQKKIYRSYFEGLKKDDIPPYPTNGLKDIYKPLIEGHKRVGGGGELLVFTEINEKGGVNKVIVFKTPSKDLAELATTVMFNTKFDPPTCGGEPCTMEFPFQYHVPRRFKDIRTLNQQDFFKRDDSRGS